MKNAEIITPAATDTLFCFSTTSRLMELCVLLQQASLLHAGTAHIPGTTGARCNAGGDLSDQVTLLQSQISPTTGQSPSPTPNAAHYLAVLIAQDQIALGRML